MSVIAGIAAKEIFEFVLAFMEAAPALIQAGADLKGLFGATSDSLKKMQEEGRGPNDEEWDAMNKMIEALRLQFHSTPLVSVGPKP
jgi:hypothetical protein